MSGLSSTAKTVNGNIDGLTVSGKALTISKAAVGNNVVLQYNNGFSINLASDVKDISFTGMSSADTITNNGSNVSIFGGAGNDSIVNSNLGNSAKIYGGDGVDTVYNSAASVSIASGLGNDYLYNYSGGTKSTITGGDGADTVYNYAASVSIASGLGNDYIYNSAASVTIDVGDGVDTVYNYNNYNSVNGGAGNDYIYNNYYATIDGGAGNDTVINNAASNVTINTAQGNDSIKLGSSVKSFRAEGFGAGDVIELATSATKLETISGGIKAGNVSISGISSIATVKNAWSTLSNGISYGQTTTAGAKLSGTKITYDSLSSSSTFFTITGITSTVGVSLSGKDVTLYNTALNGVTGTVSISGGDYKLKLASDVPTVSTVTSGWKTLTSGNVAYLEGSKTAYYLLSGDSKSVTYNASVAGAKKVEFSGVKGTPTLSNGIVSLTANNFNSNVGVVSNDGKYQFALSGSFGNKKFTGASGVDTITNNGSNIVIDGSAGNDKITNNGSNVSIVGGAGNDTVTNSGFSVTITGGAGNDVFSYSKGSFKITDYTANVDKVSLDIAKVEDVTLSNKDITLKLGQSDSITIANGKDKKITFAQGKKTNQYIFDNHAIFNSGKTAVSLLATTPAFNANSYSNLVTVDATKTANAVNIIGNAKANKIITGAKGSTLNGG